MGSGLLQFVVVIAVVLLPTLVFGGVLGGVRLVRRWKARRPAPPVVAGPPIERIAPDCRRLRTQRRRVLSEPPGPGRAVRVRAVEGAYVEALTAACRALDVVPPCGGTGSGRVAGTELARVEGDLRDRGLAVDLSEAR